MHLSLLEDHKFNLEIQGKNIGIKTKIEGIEIYIDENKKQCLYRPAQMEDMELDKTDQEEEEDRFSILDDFESKGNKNRTDAVPKLVVILNDVDLDLRFRESDEKENTKLNK